MAKSDLQIVISATDKTGGAFKSTEQNVSKLENAFTRAVFKGVALERIVEKVAVSIYELGKSAITAAIDLEQTTIAFTTMLGSAKQADRFIRDLTDFAAKTPFELKGLEEASKKLLAYGFAQQEILPNLEALGNIASGVGMEKLPNLILAFGQVRAATRLTGMELRQFQEAGVPLLQTLADQFGVSAAKMKDMISEGKVGFPDVEKALKSLSSEGGRFFNLMANQSETLGGKISNLKDAWTTFLREAGTPFLEWGKNAVDVLIGILTAINKVIQAVPKLRIELRELLEKVPWGFQKAAEMLIPGFKKISEWAKDTSKDFANSLPMALDKVVDSTNLIEDSFESLGKKVNSVVDKMKDLQKQEEENTNAFIAGQMKRKQSFEENLADSIKEAEEKRKKIMQEIAEIEASKRAGKEEEGRGQRLLALQKDLQAVSKDIEIGKKAFGGDMGKIEALAGRGEIERAVSTFQQQQGEATVEQAQKQSEIAEKKTNLIVNFDFKGSTITADDLVAMIQRELGKALSIANINK